MKGKKLFALACCAALAFCLLTGCGDEKTQGDGAEEPKTETEAKGDPIEDAAGYYQYTYDVEGLGMWVNYIHLYEESTLGKVFYAGYAGNQVTFAGTYKIEKKSCDYSVCMTREDSEADPQKMTEGTTDYTITFMDFNGGELGSCAYDGKYIYNDTTAVAGIGAENVAFEKDPEGIDSKYGKAEYGYCGEVGVPVIKAELESDATCTVSINHDGSYSDMMEVEVVGTWEVGEDGVTYTLTPDSSSDTGAVLVVSEDGQSATYTPDGGEAVTLKVKNEKPSVATFSGEAGDVAICTVKCYNDMTCEAFVDVEGTVTSLEKGTYVNNEDATITFTFDTLGEVSSKGNEDASEFTLEYSYKGAPGVGDINATLTQE